MPTVNLFFFKYQGAGNDFILIDDRLDIFPDSSSLIKQLCDRRFGIGSDGVMLIKKSDQADIKLDFINPDGSRSFCGNGSRCGLRFAKILGEIEETCSFEAIDGVHQGEIKNDVVRISMMDVDTVSEHPSGYLLHTGSPHLIIEVENLDEIDVKTEGARIRFGEEFKEHGINVNFVTYGSDRNLRIRTYERGVEDETLSCGTGVTAAALSMAIRNGFDSGPIKVKSRGGDLEVDFSYVDQGFQSVWLQGPAKKVFSGEIVI
ncbi:MAG: diaminopimelate epimerase [Flavobacteriales bacterium]|nr:diaminopimelate epimerase [Flavobacteriales bacterium]